MSKLHRISLYFDGLETIARGQPDSRWTLTRWHASAKSPVQAGAVIAEFESDKMTVEYEVLYSGTLHPLIHEREEIRPCEPIAWMEITQEEYSNYLSDPKNRRVTVELAPEELFKLERIRGNESLNELASRLFRLGMWHETESAAPSCDTITTIIYRVMQEGVTKHVLLTPPSEDDLASLLEHGSDEDQEVHLTTVEIPVVPGSVTMWDSFSDSDVPSQTPHLHFKCPRCARAHNVDLEEGDRGPRFACCDSCGWDSMVWIAWNPS